MVKFDKFTAGHISGPMSLWAYMYAYIVFKASDHFTLYLGPLGSNVLLEQISNMALCIIFIADCILKLRSRRHFEVA